MDLFVLIDKTLDQPTLQLYYDKMQPVYVFYPHFVSCNGSVAVYDKFKGNPEIMDVDTYNKIDHPKPVVTYHLIHKPTFVDIGRVGYLSRADENVKKDTDEIDQEFLTARDNLMTIEKFGMHTQNVDLEEVINLISPNVPVKHLDKVKKIFVNTEMYADGNITQCYDSKHDRHRAKSTFWIVM